MRLWAPGLSQAFGLRLQQDSWEERVAILRVIGCRDESLELATNLRARQISHPACPFGQPRGTAGLHQRHEFRKTALSIVQVDRFTEPSFEVECCYVLKLGPLINCFLKLENVPVKIEDFFGPRVPSRKLSGSLDTLIPSSAFLRPGIWHEMLVRWLRSDDNPVSVSRQAPQYRVENVAYQRGMEPISVLCRFLLFEIACPLRGPVQ